MPRRFLRIRGFPEQPGAAVRRARRLLGIQLALCAVAVLGILAAAWTVPLPQRLSEPDSRVLRYRDGAPAHIALAPDDRLRIGTSLDRVDPRYLHALLRLEDKRFHDHLGVDPAAVLRAALLNIRRGETVSGGSTLTMQLIRMVEPRPRVLRSKVIEALRAVQLELRWSKREILEAYLRFLPFGRNIEGVEAGAPAYFGHGAAHLSADEIAVLLAVPQNPNRRYPHPDNAARLRAARDNIAQRLADQGAMPLGAGGALVDPEELLRMIREVPLPPTLLAPPREAAHVAAHLRNPAARHRSATRSPEPARIDTTTTLDRGSQQLVEKRLRAAREDFVRRGIRNAAVVVIDHASMEVRALAGGFDFSSSDDGAQIPAFAVPRSPGSALKPFIYALAVDRGLALPGFLVPDIPNRYGSWAPTNYDDRFEGLVQLEDALSRSRNLPFVDLLAEFGADNFVAELRRMGAVSPRTEPGFYGLSMSVGGIELSPLELAGFYAVLARGGQALPVALLPRAEPRSPSPVLSPGAAWMTRQTLSIRDRPDFPARRDLTTLPPSIHWKTGTSSGHRDAWAIGSGPVHTAAVWLGNLDNASSANLVGADAAGPLLFDLLEALDGRRSRPDPMPEGELTDLDVCSYSGHPAGRACPRRKTVPAPIRRAPVTTCPYHVLVDVDRATGLALRPHCRRGRSWETRPVLLWPSTIRRRLAVEGRSLPELPDWAPGCEPPARGGAPRILSPQPKQIALLLPGLDPERQGIPLLAESGADGRLSWFVDGEHIGSAAPHEQLWWTPRLGEHEILVQDDHGRSSRQVVEVRERR